MSQAERNARARELINEARRRVRDENEAKGDDDLPSVAAPVSASPATVVSEIEVQSANDDVRTSIWQAPGSAQWAIKEARRT